MNKTKIRGSSKVVKHFISLSFLSSLVLGTVMIWIPNYNHGIWDVVFYGVLTGVFIIHPIVLTIINLFFLFARVQDKALFRKGKHIEYLTVLLGSLYSLFLFPFTSIQWMDWHETLYNSQLHTPIWTQAQPTITILAIIGICGYFFLSVVNICKIPPLVSVCAIAAIYLGMAMCILWIVQIVQRNFLLVYLCLFPFNCVILGAKLIYDKIRQWKTQQSIAAKEYHNKILNWLNQRLLKAENWPVAAFLIMWPLLGILIGILILFGQRPDSVIRAWTETSDWNLSTKIAPPNVFYDEHYLCTVAAGGHRKIVKPLRMGERHGHRVVVNRQLCIANAFEQILEERTPIFHRYLRGFYDTYGFPVARMIHSPYVADLIYLLMKPLEWLFLIVLYSCDVNPENRIAVQYLPNSNPKINKPKDK